MQIESYFKILPWSSYLRGSGYRCSSSYLLPSTCICCSGCSLLRLSDILSSCDLWLPCRSSSSNIRCSYGSCGRCSVPTSCVHIWGGVSTWLSSHNISYCTNCRSLMSSIGSSLRMVILASCNSISVCSGLVFWGTFSILPFSVWISHLWFSLTHFDFLDLIFKFEYDYPF